MEYNITFDKGNSRIGFNGDTQEVQILDSDSSLAISQYVMFAFSLLLLFFLGFVFFIMIFGREDQNKE